jgi:hypothetical protein
MGAEFDGDVAAASRGIAITADAVRSDDGGV